jgi:2'-5' RNA ligase
MPGARWVEARNLHITLRFIGEVEDGLAREIHDELADTIRAPALSLSVTGFGTFGSRQPRALFAAVDKPPDLVRLQARVEAVVTRLGLDPEPRKFTPHITLARLKDAPTNRLQDYIAGHSPLSIGPFAIDRVTLFRSHLGRGGAEYESIADYPLVH